MKTVIALLLVLVSGFAHAVNTESVCESAELTRDGWKYTPYPCPVDPDEAAQARRCGKDFNAIRVGMNLKRFEQCSEALAYVTETVVGGVRVETWRSTIYFIHARDGRIIGYTRR